MKYRMLLPLLLSVSFLVFFSGCGDPDAKNWIPLFDGESFDGWKISENSESARIENGAIVCNGTRAHLFYDGPVMEHNFKNFEFKADVMARANSNSGIYVHSKYQQDGWPDHGYEIQVNNSQKPSADGTWYEYKKTGSIYAVRNTFKQFIDDDEWFTMRIKVVVPRIQVWINDMLVSDYVEPEHPVRPSEPGRVLSSGTFAFQCHDPNSTAMYKNIMVKPLPDDADPGEIVTPVVDETYTTLLNMNHDNYPVIDFHVHLKEDLTLDMALAQSMRDGIMYGIAPNCGLDFPINTDEGIYEFIESMKDKPVYLGMQAEGREWMELFSKKAIAKFDYVFSDAMTFTDHRGKRIHIWKNEEVEIDDVQKWMDLYVEKIVGVLHEPIDIYVNSTVLPEIIRDRYDELWTDARMDKVIKAALENDVAIEINDRYCVPSATFIKKAKAAGCKFAMGTNNRNAEELKRLEYCIEMIQECGIGQYDFFMPRPANQKKILSR